MVSSNTTLDPIRKEIRNNLDNVKPADKKKDLLICWKSVYSKRKPGLDVPYQRDGWIKMFFIFF